MSLALAGSARLQQHRLAALRYRLVREFQALRLSAVGAPSVGLPRPPPCCRPLSVAPAPAASIKPKAIRAAKADRRIGGIQLVVNSAVAEDINARPEAKKAMALATRFGLADEVVRAFNVLASKVALETEDVVKFLIHYRDAVRTGRLRYTPLTLSAGLPLKDRSAPIADPENPGQFVRFIKNSEACRTVSSIFSTLRQSPLVLDLRVYSALLTVATTFGRRGDIATVLPTSFTVQGFKAHAALLEKRSVWIAKQRSLSEKKLDSMALAQSASNAAREAIAHNLRRESHVELGSEADMFEDESKLSLCVADVLEDIFLLYSPSALSGVDERSIRWPDDYVFNPVIDNLISGYPPDRPLAWKIFETMARSPLETCKPTEPSIVMMIDAAARSSDGIALDKLEEYIRKVDFPRSPLLNRALLHCNGRVGRFDAAQRIWDEMKNDKATYQRTSALVDFIDACAFAERMDVAEDTWHHVEHVMKYKLQPNCYSAMIEGYLRSEDFVKATLMFDTVKHDGIELTSKMVSTYCYFFLDQPAVHLATEAVKVLELFKHPEWIRAQRLLLSGAGGVLKMDREKFRRKVLARLKKEEVERLAREHAARLEAEMKVVAAKASSAGARQSSLRASEPAQAEANSPSKPLPVKANSRKGPAVDPEEDGWWLGEEEEEAEDSGASADDVAKLVRVNMPSKAKLKTMVDGKALLKKVDKIQLLKEFNQEVSGRHERPLTAGEMRQFQDFLRTVSHALKIKVHPSSWANS